LEKDIREAAASAGRESPAVVTVCLDVTDEKSVEGAAKAISDAFKGKLDILLNNAGYLEEFHPIAESNVDEYDWVWKVNFRGPYLVTVGFEDAEGCPCWYVAKLLSRAVYCFGSSLFRWPETFLCRGIRKRNGR
jgi:hypothetical protein